MTREELLKSKVIKALSIAVSAKSTDGYEKMFLKQVASEVSKYDVYSVNIAEYYSVKKRFNRFVKLITFLNIKSLYLILTFNIITDIKK